MTTACEPDGAAVVRLNHSGSAKPNWPRSGRGCERRHRILRNRKREAVAAAGLGDMELYVATRHYFGWYAFNVLGLPDKDIALHLGHRDGGKLVRTTYGHPDEAMAREKLREAFRTAPAAPIPLRRKGTG
jgi:integrase